MVHWTEMFDSFSPAGTGWQEYDIYTNKSVPKGAIALIRMGHTVTTASRTLGVRTDGSSLNRYIQLSYSSGGNIGYTAFVKVDSSTG